MAVIILHTLLILFDAAIYTIYTQIHIICNMIMRHINIHIHLYVYICNVYIINIITDYLQYNMPT